MPDNWNGTLVQFSHGYYVPEWIPDPIFLTIHQETEKWLLDNGFALAASEFKNQGIGYAVEDAAIDQRALLDWFDRNVGTPRRTIGTGMSGGATIAVLLAERNPGRFAGVSTICAEYDSTGSWNAALDVNFVVKTLLAPNERIELVRAADPKASAAALAAAVVRARTSPAGRAKLALAAAMANVPAWHAVGQAPPVEVAERVLAQSNWLETMFALGMGPTGQADLTAHTGGTPSWNTGVDYRRQLAKSANHELVRQAYREAGVDLRADQDALASAERISADPAAVAYTYRHGVARGSAGLPTVTLHTVADAGSTDQERWYAEQVRRHGDGRDLTQLYLDRAGHCAITAAEEITALRTLFERIENGRWPHHDPAALNGAASRFGEGFHDALDIEHGGEVAVTPGFTRFTPARSLRPSR